MTPGEKKVSLMKGKKVGGAGYRSRYLSHAKRALYHLSYAPISDCFDKKQKSRLKLILLYEKSLEAPGIDPGTYRMLSERSTIWATRPFLI